MQNRMMGFVWYNRERPSEQTADVTGSLPDSFIIAVASVISLAALLLILAIASYCYNRREESHWKSERPLLHYDTESPRSSALPIRPVTYKVNSISGKTVLVPHDPGISVPQGQNLKTSQERNYMYHHAPQIQRTYYAKRQYNTHPNNGVRIMRVTHPSAPVQYKRPVVIYHQEGVNQTMPRSEQPHTVPHVRHMGVYKPKVIQEYFSPHNIRQYVNNQSTGRPTLDSSYSTEYGSSGEARHTWYPVQQEKIQLLQSDNKADQTRQNKNKHKKKQKTKFVSSAHNGKGQTQNEISFTIVDYLVDNEQKQGPISTSTPRDRVDQLSVDVDPNVDLIERRKRQRLPHEGSVDKIPLLF